MTIQRNYSLAWDYNLLVAQQGGDGSPPAPFVFHPSPESIPAVHHEEEDQPEENIASDIAPNKRHWFIDPGHGPETPGKRSPVLPDGRQLLEYKFTRDIARELARLCQGAGITYNFTIPIDAPNIGNTLQRRTDFANDYPAKYPKAFLSIHSNANYVEDETKDFGPGNGLETWHYFKPGNPEIESKQYARIFQKHLVDELRLKDRGLKFTDDTKINPVTGKPYTQLWVLRKAFCPSVLVEVGFYNNLEDLNFLLRKDTPNRAAAALFSAMQEIENL